MTVARNLRKRNNAVVIDRHCRKRKRRRPASVPQSRDYGAAGSAAPHSSVLRPISFSSRRRVNVLTRSCALIASLKNSSRVAMTFIGASVKYEYGGDRERSDKGST